MIKKEKCYQDDGKSHLIASIIQIFLGRTPITTPPLTPVVPLRLQCSIIGLGPAVRAPVLSRNPETVPVYKHPPPHHLTPLVT